MYAASKPLVEHFPVAGAAYPPRSTEAPNSCPHYVSAYAHPIWATRAAQAQRRACTPACMYLVAYIQALAGAA